MKAKGLIIKVTFVTIMVLVLIPFLKEQGYLQLVFSLKYLLYLVVTILAIILLAMRKVSNLLRIFTLFILFVIFGILIGIHPSPLCALTKSMLIYHLRSFLPPPMIIMAAAMILFTILGNKIFCGWICPLGCVQEVIFKVSVFIKKFKFPFTITNSIRFSLFAIFLIFIFSFRINIYNFFNPFELFHWQFYAYDLFVISVVMLASLFYYRPFCQFLCPAGLITWPFEHLSFFKIHKNNTRCTSCNKCIKESPCTAINSIMQDHKIIPDCYACGKCIESCPEDALSFSPSNYN
ncbi:MAG: 4Fe-4S binding protein [Deltaproteobacteria bacterium]|nr:4Fe-4S binding protein [Deltaproteobacteria bacterium]